MVTRRKRLTRLGVACLAAAGCVTGVGAGLLRAAVQLRHEAASLRGISYGDIRTSDAWNDETLYAQTAGDRTVLAGLHVTLVVADACLPCLSVTNAWRHQFATAWRHVGIGMHIVHCGMEPYSAELMESLATQGVPVALSRVTDTVRFHVRTGVEVVPISIVDGSTLAGCVATGIPDAQWYGDCLRTERERDRRLILRRDRGSAVPILRPPSSSRLLRK